MSRLNSKGQEIPDSTPVEVPAGFKRPPSLEEQVQRLIRTSLSEWAERNEMETFEEAEDFEVGEDFDPHTPYETFFDPVLQKEITPHEFQERAEYYKNRYAKATREYFERVDRDNILAENLLRRVVQRDRASPAAAADQEPPNDAPSSPPSQREGGRKGDGRPSPRR